jgi:hypothetical protein
LQSCNKRTQGNHTSQSLLVMVMVMVMAAVLVHAVAATTS